MTRTPKVVRADAVWRPAPTDKRTRASLRAFSRGEATPEQQREAFRWIYFHAAMMAADTQVPGDPHGSAYLSGRRSVAIQIWDAIEHDEQEKVNHE